MSPHIPIIIVLKGREGLNCAVFTANTANDINNEILNKGTAVPIRAPIPVPIRYDFNFICGFERGIFLPQATPHNIFIVCVEREWEGLNFVAVVTTAQQQGQHDIIVWIFVYGFGGEGRDGIYGICFDFGATGVALSYPKQKQKNLLINDNKAWIIIKIKQYTWIIQLTLD